MQQVAEQVEGQRRRDQQDQVINGLLGCNDAARAGQVIDDELEEVERRESDTALQDHENDARHRPAWCRSPDQPQGPIRPQAVAPSPMTTCRPTLIQRRADPRHDSARGGNVGRRQQLPEAVEVAAADEHDTIVLNPGVRHERRAIELADPVTDPGRMTASRHQGSQR